MGEKRAADLPAKRQSAQRAINPHARQAVWVFFA